MADGRPLQRSSQHPFTILTDRELPMKLLILADLHLDEIADQELLSRLGDEIAKAGREADALIIAGDMTESAVNVWPSAIRWLGKYYPTAQTTFIPGNHDYYDGRLDTLDADLERICQAEGASFGQCRRMDLGDTRILMTTLWTDMLLFDSEGDAAVERSLWNAEVMMPDYGYRGIMNGEDNLPALPEDTISVHMRQRAWLSAELERPWGGKTVVVTHHAPSAAVGGAISSLSPCFVSNLDHLIERHRPEAWVFGHTHRPAELRMPGGTLLRNVSLGYAHEFHPGNISQRVRTGLIQI